MKETVVHPTAVIGPDVSLGEGVWVGPFCVIVGKVSIDDDTRIRSHVVIGTPAEKAGHLTEPGMGVVIGKRCHISEFVTIHSGVENKTIIGNDCVILTKAQIGHCSIIEDGVTLSCLTVVGGHGYVMRGANIGLGAKIHQRQLIGSYSMIGGNAFVTKAAKIIPGCSYAGVPAKFLKNNNVGVVRAGVSQEQLQAEIERFHRLWLAQNKT